jgi:hypothetical protein
MMKDFSHNEWTRRFGEFDYSRPYGIWCVYNYVDAYEEAVKFLIPDAHTWCEEWSDISVMIAQIKRLYGVDFTTDRKGLYALLNAAKHRRDVATCTRYLHQTKACSITLLKHLWGSGYAEKLQLGFLSICKRYRANRKYNRTSRSRYTYSNFVNHWIYKQIDMWRRDKTVEIQDKVREKLFNIAIGI